MNRLLPFVLLFFIVGCKKNSEDVYQPPSLKRWKLWVYEGDSITDLSFNGENYPFQLTNIYSYIAASKQLNVARSGDLVQYMLNEYGTQVHNFRPALRDSALFVLMAGTNDCGTGRTSAQVYADLKTEWAYARNDGFKVVALCITRSTANIRDTTALAVNKLIVADPKQYDYLVRTDLILPDPNNKKHFYDGLHPTKTGSSLIAKEIVSVLTK